MTRGPRLVRRPRAVIFDMDGLILDTESLGARTWAEAASLTGVEFDLALLPAMIGRNYRDCRVFLRQHYGDTYPVEKLTAHCLVAFDAMVLEDSEPGVRAAIAAGIAPIMVPDLHPPSAELLAMDMLVLPSLLDVAAHLARLPL